MKNPRRIDLIVIHCSATRVNKNFTVEQLEACHKARGFKGIGYHFYITKDGILYPCRPENEIGAHARHYNAHSIGICYEGGLDENGKPGDVAMGGVYVLVHPPQPCHAAFHLPHLPPLIYQNGDHTAYDRH